ncbi:N-acetylmuramoyl-L-alanine amidase [Enhydrobacter aerosaccus]|uniref:N-acetylmuramoyl-L-alanine amidase n=1 Tax=Enhydrobacter aerosaccus TaxID=225324 RepID=A0A1T4JPF0_9HYPH|nr:N-acetylmuramoyl-L-alanine amidase [Enhydrobacter aerosaccus]SJZ32001.1 N-acetylmuramoyl-L-alanine amidase [Enhydrobacter aerosaccus]
MSLTIVDRPSPNHAPRPETSAVDTLVLHYTELPLQSSLDILSDPKRELRVSAHYVLAEEGTVYRLVPEQRVAWHAGRSYWRGRDSLNATSIGIEIVNLHGDHHDYPDRQIAALIDLCRDILGRHPAIVPRNVVGHSDIAPRRKIDPGLRFPWKTLAAAGVGVWPKPGARPFEGDVQEALQRFGYVPAVDLPEEEILKAFQRHFRPARVDGIADIETRSLLAALLDQVGAGP